MLNSSTLQKLKVQLRQNRIDTTSLSDAGLEHLKGMTSLQYLLLNGTNVSDAGLERLTGMKSLQWLLLDGTNVSDEGVKKLQQALPKCTIYH